MIADGHKIKPCRICKNERIELATNAVGKSVFGIILCEKCGCKYETVTTSHTAAANILVSLWNEGAGVPMKYETVVYDQEIIHPNCTVQILRNSITGAESVGWWKNE